MCANTVALAHGQTLQSVYGMPAYASQYRWVFATWSALLPEVGGLKLQARGRVWTI